MRDGNGRSGLGLGACLEARARALVLLSLVLDVPLLRAPAVLLTGAPRVETHEIGGVPVEIARPAGRGPWPTWVFVSGAHPLRRREPIVRRLIGGLARAGYLVVAPDPPGLGDGIVTCETLDATTAVVQAAAELPEARDGRVALLGASMGAGLVLLAAARPGIADRVSVVAAAAPYADISKLVCLATTSCYDDDGSFVPYPVTGLHRLVVARSLAGALTDPVGRGRLLAALERAELEGPDSLAELASLADGLGAEAQSVVSLLANSDPGRFREFYDALPERLRSSLAALSPLAVCTGLRVPVELVVPPNDQYFPPGEVLALARALPTARLTVTGSLDHTRPRASLDRLADFRRFDAFVVRSLAHAAWS